MKSAPLTCLCDLLQVIEPFCARIMVGIKWEMHENRFLLIPEQDVKTVRWVLALNHRRHSGWLKECKQGQESGEGQICLGNRRKFGVTWAGWQMEKPS